MSNASEPSERSGEATSTSTSSWRKQLANPLVIAALIGALGAVGAAIVGIIAAIVGQGGSSAAPESASTVTVTATVTTDVPKTRTPQPPDTTEPETPRPAQSTYLTSRRPDAEYGNWYDDAVWLDGNEYEHGMVGNGYATCYDATRDYAFKGGYKRFRAMVGIADDSRSTVPTTIKVLVDGERKAGAVVELGKPLPVDIDVTGAVRLRLMVIGDCARGAASIAVGDARLVP